uniref:Uncharacterized protein n=1 Tax=Glossina palpalis gambiensis TaxID=67801 RepID=A0A1B0BHV4_9MUSC
MVKLKELYFKNHLGLLFSSPLSLSSSRGSLSSPFLQANTKDIIVRVLPKPMSSAKIPPLVGNFGCIVFFSILEAQELSDFLTISSVELDKTIVVSLCSIISKSLSTVNEAVWSASAKSSLLLAYWKLFWNMVEDKLSLISVSKWELYRGKCNGEFCDFAEPASSSSASLRVRAKRTRDPLESSIKKEHVIIAQLFKEFISLNFGNVPSVSDSLIVESWLEPVDDMSSSASSSLFKHNLQMKAEFQTYEDTQTIEEYNIVKPITI